MEQCQDINIEPKSELQTTLANKDWKPFLKQVSDNFFFFYVIENTSSSYISKYQRPIFTNCWKYTYRDILLS